MSEDIQTLQRFAYKSFSGILSDGYLLFVKNWLIILGPMAVFSIISIVLKNIMLSDLYWNLNLLNVQIDKIFNQFTIDPNSLTEADYQTIMQYFLLFIGTIILEGIISSIFTIIAMSSISSYLLKRYKGNDTAFFEEFKSSFNLRLIAIAVLLGIGIPIGFLLLIAPGLILFGYYIFSVITYHHNKKTPLREARFVSKGYFWKLIGIFFISSLIIWIFNFIFQLALDFAIPINAMTYSSWYNPTSRNYIMIILYDLIYNQLINILLAPLFICFLTVLYSSIKSKKEIKDKLGKEPYSTPHLYSEYRTLNSEKHDVTSINENSVRKFDRGLYCPFCGTFMEKKFDRCPHCNKMLDFEI